MFFLRNWYFDQNAENGETDLLYRHSDARKFRSQKE